MAPLKRNDQSKGKVISLGRIDFNAPVILGLTVVCFIILMVNMATGGTLNRYLSIFYISWLRPGQYIRLFTHVLAHANMAHFYGNFLLILAIGPMVEEKYGSWNLLMMFAITAVTTGLVETLMFPRIALIGASGLAFMLILLASFVNIRDGHLPMTVLLVGVLYIGNEVLNGLRSQDNISQLAHIVGGLCGAGFGIFLNYGRRRKKGQSS